MSISKLAKSGTSIGLYWTKRQPGGLCDVRGADRRHQHGPLSDGGPAIYILPAATPRTNNAAPNTAPNLLAPGSKFIYLGQTLSFTAQAIDTDVQSKWSPIVWTQALLPMPQSIPPMVSSVGHRSPARRPHLSDSIAG